MPISINLCDTKGCGEIYNTYFCKRCDTYIQDYCKRCHETHFSQIDRMRDLSRLKRGLHV